MLLCSRPQVKLVLVGDAGVGKTSALAFFKEVGASLTCTCSCADGDSFCAAQELRAGDESTSATVGVEFVTKLMSLKCGDKVKVAVWDTAGEHAPPSLLSFL